MIGIDSGHRGAPCAGRGARAAGGGTRSTSEGLRMRRASVLGQKTTEAPTLARSTSPCPIQALRGLDDDLLHREGRVRGHPSNANLGTPSQTPETRVVPAIWASLGQSS